MARLGRGRRNRPFFHRGSVTSVAAAPTVDSFNPTSGPVGTPVTITGTNFTGATSCKFNGVEAVGFTVDSATQVSATVPAGATTGPISVTTGGGTGTSAGNFTVTVATSLGSLRSAPIGLPRVFWTIDDAPVDIADWSCNASANFGFDQMRGMISADQARSLHVVQGSIVKAWTEYGAQLWEGRLATDPKVTQRSTAEIAAQGHGVEAAKNSARMFFKATGPALFSDATQPPFSIATDANGISLQQLVNASAAAQVADNRQLVWSVASAGGTHYEAAMWVPGSKITRIKIESPSAGAAASYFLVQSGDVPGGSLRTEAKFGGGTPGAQDITFAAPGSVLVISLKNDTLIGATAQLTGITVWGESAANLQYSDVCAALVGGALGWDVSSILGRGGADAMPLDWTADKASLLSFLASLDDFVWGAWEKTSTGPRLSFEPWGQRIWDVSAATEASWDLNPLELFNRAVVSYTPTAVNPTGASSIVVQTTIAADPDPLQAEGIVNVLPISIGGQQQSGDLAVSVGFRALQAALQQRYRGQISTSHAFDSQTGRDGLFEVRPGDLVRIRDFSPIGQDLSLRIMDVEYRPDGITIGCEMPAVLGGLTISSGGSNIGSLPSAVAPTGMGPSAPTAPSAQPAGRSFTMPGGRPGPIPRAI